ncbi:MAG: dihydrodipicolinate synthase family protein, partial [Rectinema sp.]|nr:dihydrodipicolinate synthase family protein [Rectinema sp.]
HRRFDERRERALVRYYLDAGAGGIAAGVHTTQFAIREHNLYKPVLLFVSQEIDAWSREHGKPIVKIGGICGETPQALREAEFLVLHGYHAGLLSLAALKNASLETLIAHAVRVAEIIPLVGFYLQPDVGGRVLPYEFWRAFMEIESVVAVKVAPFHRYRTLDVVRALAESGRAGEIALYTGNDDHIILDLLTPFTMRGPGGERITLRFRGGLLGQWSVWTKKAVELLNEIHTIVDTNSPVPPHMLALAQALTDANGAIFDVANQYRGCIAGIHEVLRRQGLLEGIWCLDPTETLSTGQAEEISRVHDAYPELHDDEFVRQHLSFWFA